MVKQSSLTKKSSSSSLLHCSPKYKGVEDILQQTLSCVAGRWWRSGNKVIVQPVCSLISDNQGGLFGFSC